MIEISKVKEIIINQTIIDVVMRNDIFHPASNKFLDFILRRKQKKRTPNKDILNYILLSNGVKLYVLIGDRIFIDYENLKNNANQLKTT